MANHSTRTAKNHLVEEVVMIDSDFNRPPLYQAAAHGCAACEAEDATWQNVTPTLMHRAHGMRLVH